MKNKVAIRNLSLCTKDCLCLFVCPTGASDTENSIIDTTNCIGCGACAEACPSKAITLVPIEYPKPQDKSEVVLQALNKLIQSKAKLHLEASSLDGRLFRAIEKSARIMAEDLSREAGYMIPQCENSRKLLEHLESNSIAKEEASSLLSTLNFIEE